MKTTSQNPEAFESTYALIIRSEEKERGIAETLVYMLLMMSTVFAIAQFGQHPFAVPTVLSSPTVNASEGQRRV
jgi:hypothetical protein